MRVAPVRRKKARAERIDPSLLALPLAMIAGAGVGDICVSITTANSPRQL